MPAIAPFIPAITAATAIGSGVMQYQGQKKAQQATERAAQQEQADRARIAAEAEQNQVAQNSAMQAQQQEARKAFSQRLSNQSELLRQQLARQNLLGTPAGEGRQAEMERQGILSADSLSADLAGQAEQARQKALYSLPGLSQRGTQLQQELGASNPTTALYGDLSNLASTTFGRTDVGRQLLGGYRLSTPKTTPSFNPKAPTPLPNRVFKDPNVGISTFGVKS